MDKKKLDLHSNFRCIPLFYWVVPTDEEGRIAKETASVANEVIQTAAKKSEDNVAIA